MLKNDVANIISRFKRGEKEVFTEIIVEYQSILVNFVRKYTGSSATAEDIAQEIFLKIYKELPHYSEEGKFSSWLFRIATNYCLNELKRKTVRREISLDEEGEESLSLLQTLPDTSQIAPDKQIEQKEMLQALRQAIAVLPEKQRIALILSQYEHLSYQGIAEILHTTVSAVESLIFRAKQTLKQKLAELK